MLKIEKVFFTIIMVATLIGIAWAKLDKVGYESLYAVEDGVIEWATVIMLLSLSILSLRRGWLSKNKAGKFFLLSTLFQAGLFFFGAGEEISWGQRIFNIESTDFFVKNNSQHEMNLHNLIFSGMKINKIIFGTGLGIIVASYLLLLPYLYRKQNVIRELANRFAIPVAKTYHQIAYFILFILVILIASPKRGELLEFGGVCLFFLISYNPENKTEL